MQEHRAGDGLPSAAYYLGAAEWRAKNWQPASALRASSSAAASAWHRCVFPCGRGPQLPFCFPRRSWPRPQARLCCVAHAPKCQILEREHAGETSLRDQGFPTCARQSAARATGMSRGISQEIGCFHPQSPTCACSTWPADNAHSQIPTAASSRFLGAPEDPRPCGHLQTRFGLEPGKNKL